MLHRNMALKTISESVYVGMCHNIGTPNEVAFRREISDASELFINRALQNKIKVPTINLCLVKLMKGGSRREGFRLNGSDLDIMVWPNYRVIWYFAQFQFYNIHGQGLILCDSSDSPPGFTLLWLPLEETNRPFLRTCFEINGRLYISSSRYRELFLSRGFTTHGPCNSVRYKGKEIDSASCFVSDFWPPSATSWIERCHSWPPIHVVHDIIRSGCHFVAIGHKLGNHADDEWRISFSQAEIRLVYSMNHTQFLTYGLLKLFLKEIINNGLREEDKLLCSYHMKTAVFWVIQQSIISHWCPQNTLACFWVCFKLLLKFVYDGVCPNFFIPANNMFLGKIQGGAHTPLFKQLYTLYREGVTLLLHISSIRSFIINVLCNPRPTVCTDVHTLIPDSLFNKSLFIEISEQSHSLYNSDRLECVKCIRIVEHFISLPLTRYQIFWLQRTACKVFQSNAFMLHHTYRNTGSNRSVYIINKIACHMLVLGAKFGFDFDLLYISMYYYKTFRYKEALLAIEMANLKYRARFDQENDVETTRGQSLSSLFRNIEITSVELGNEVSYIDELIPEQQSARNNSVYRLIISRSVLLHMLEFLCSRHVDSVRAQKSLDSLQVVVHHVNGEDISWEILGICQQITGNLQAALYSYQQALSQNQKNCIQTATIQRLQNLRDDH